MADPVIIGQTTADQPPVTKVTINIHGASITVEAAEPMCAVTAEAMRRLTEARAVANQQPEQTGQHL